MHENRARVCGRVLSVLLALGGMTGAARAEPALYCTSLKGRQILAQAVQDFIKDHLLAFATDSGTSTLRLNEFEIIESRQLYRDGNYVACHVSIEAAIRRGAYLKTVPFGINVAAGYDRQARLNLRLMDPSPPASRQAAGLNGAQFGRI